LTVVLCCSVLFWSVLNRVGVCVPFTSTFFFASYAFNLNFSCDDLHPRATDPVFFLVLCSSTVSD
jgi:hypothetical protein